LNGTILHGLVHAAAALDEEGQAALFAKAGPDFFAMIRRLSLLSGQVEQQLAAGADLRRVVAPIKPANPHEAGVAYFQRLLNLDRLTQAPSSTFRGSDRDNPETLNLYPPTPN
jgi:hypothetical protein